MDGSYFMYKVKYFNIVKYIPNTDRVKDVVEEIKMGGLKQMGNIKKRT